MKELEELKDARIAADEIEDKIETVATAAVGMMLLIMFIVTLSASFSWLFCL